MKVLCDSPAIQIQGRIYASNLVYAACQAAKSKKVFNTLLEMADEAVSARTNLEKLLESHPLRSQLEGLKTADALTYLLAITFHTTNQEGNKSSDKGIDVLSDKTVAAENKPKPVGQLNYYSSVSPVAVVSWPVYIGGSEKARLIHA